MQKSSFAEAWPAYNCVRCSCFDFKIEVLKQKVGFILVIVKFLLSILDFVLVPKTNPSKFNRSSFVIEIGGIWRLLYFRYKLKHVEQFFHINLCLLHFSEHGSHIKKGSWKLHEVGLDHDEIASCHFAMIDIVCRHQQVDSHSCWVQETLTNIKLV